MKLSRLYSSRPAILPAIDFQDGLNVIVAEIRLPENRDKDTHNLGKTTVGRLLDFCLLAKRNQDLFLFKHEDLFKDFVFYLELQLTDGTFATVRRSVAEPSKISLRRHNERHQDFSRLPQKEWDHWYLPFDKAREILDGWLNLTAVKPWGYRQSIGYLLRSQDDYIDVFRLRRFAGPDRNWKPYLAHSLGFDATAVKALYQKQHEIDSLQGKIDETEAEYSHSVDDISKIDGMLLLKKREVSKRQESLNSFDLASHDAEISKRVVDDIDERIADLNGLRYSAGQRQRKILKALDEAAILFDPSDAERLFNEAGVLFPGQIKRDYQQLIEFNRAISEERRQYLEEDLAETRRELASIATELEDISARRSSALSYLTSTDVFEKYKHMSAEMVALMADVSGLERRRESLGALQAMRAKMRSLKEEKIRLQSAIEGNVEAQSADGASLFSRIRLLFSEIVEEVIDSKALLSVSPNNEGNLDFKAEILDETGQSTSADRGHTYRKLLCVAFDLAVVRAHLGDNFPRFAYHDGVLESLDPRKKDRLITLLRSYSQMGVQNVITLIDSDLPTNAATMGDVFDESEVILRLHDEGTDGRLFKMDPW